MGQNNQKDQKGPKMTAAVMLVQNNQNNQKIWSLHISHTILKVRFFWDTLYIAPRGGRAGDKALSCFESYQTHFLARESRHARILTNLHPFQL